MSDLIDYIKQCSLVSSWQVGKKFGIKTAIALQSLKRLEADGVIERHYFSSSNNIVWSIKDGGNGK